MKSSQQKRLESKKRKAAAFLQIAQMNDEERQNIKERPHKKPKTEHQSSSDSDIPCKDKTLGKNDQLIKDSRHPTSLTYNNTNKEVQKKPLLDGEEYEELKRRLKERKKALQALPQFTLKSIGHEAEISMDESFRTPLFMKDLQHLLLYALMGTKAPVEPSRWCKINSWSRLSNIVCISCEGLSLKHYKQWESSNIKFSKDVSSIYFSKLEFVSPSIYDKTVAEDLAIIPLSTNQKANLKKKFGSISVALNCGAYFDLLRSVFPMEQQSKVKQEHGWMKAQQENKINAPDERESNVSLKMRLCLSLHQMIEEGYGIPLKGYMLEKWGNFAMTSGQDSYLPLTPDSPLYSVDCEMCRTSIGENELTRICVVDSSLKVVYHSLVLPENPITNYLTQFSGITKETLDGVTKRLKDVQEDLQTLLPRDAILVGQSLNSDLHALKMMHPYVIDTSVIYNITGTRSRKTKLSVLSNMFLGQDIQKQGYKGHDPEEDARAAMKLVLLKLEKGYEFGDVLLDGTLPGSQGNTLDSRGKILSTSMFTPVKDNKQRVCIVANNNILEKYKKYTPSDSSLTCETIREKSPNKEGKEENQNDTSVAALESTNEVMGKEITFETANTNKEVISKSCSNCFDNNLTICHVDFTSKMQKLSQNKEILAGKTNADFTDKPFAPEDNTTKEEIDQEERLVKKVRRMIKELWSHTSKNGLFITIWPGTKTENAFVGIAINKENI